MTRTLLVAVVSVASFGAIALERPTVAQSSSQLNVTYGPNGVQRLSYAGTVLEDLNQYPSDAFHIWHMKMTDLHGKVVSGGQYGWGEINNGRSWNAQTNTWTYNFVWGSIHVQFAQNGDNLDVTVTETNLPNSGVVLDGAVVYPLGLHMPRLPVKFYEPNYPQLAFNTTGPSVTVADYGAGQVVAVAPDARKPLYSGFWPTGNGIGYFPIISGTSPDGLATFQPHNDRPVQPGETDTFTVSLRFAPSGTGTKTLASDAYASWAKTWPPQLKWTDRRPIGTVFLANSPSGDVKRPGGYPTNPRRYFNDSGANVRSPAGLAAFQARILQQAANNVANMRKMNAQGSITWDIEGEEYPQSTSYVCAPDNIAQIAPEMESVVTDRRSPFAGMKLDDAYFKTMTNAGFRVGVCIRPQHFTLNGDGTAEQLYLPKPDISAEVIRKMKFAHDRWGATIFYVDSTVEADGAVLDASIFQQVAQALPDSLIIPEESTPKYYAYTAPFQTFIFHGDLGTDPTIHAYYPQAFSVNLINDVNAGTLASKLPQLTAAVKGGDILMGHVGYWQENNPTIVSIYQSAGVWTGAPPRAETMPGSTPAPVSTITGLQPTAVRVPVEPSPTSPVQASDPPGIVPSSKISILLPSTGSTISGKVTVTGEINVDMDAAGSYLMVDGVEIGRGRVTSAPFDYPLDTMTLSDGQHTLQLLAHDTGSNTSLSSPVTITVANAAAMLAPLAPTPGPDPVPAAVDPTFARSLTNRPALNPCWELLPPGSCRRRWMQLVRTS